MISQAGMWALLGLIAVSTVFFYVGGELSLSYENTNYSGILSSKPTPPPFSWLNWIAQRLMLMGVGLGSIAFLALAHEMGVKKRVY